jgi:hypothetical protein
VREPQLDKHAERLGDELEIPLAAIHGTAEAIEPSEDQRRIARTLEVLLERCVDDGPLRQPLRGAELLEALTHDGLHVGLKSDTSTSRGSVHR